jgi:hypothetical protein
MRTPQAEGTKGSQKWIQRAVEEAWPSLGEPILQHTSGVGPVDWLSPLRTDEFAEYRDGALLDRIGQAQLKPALAKMWPSRGPRWDALGRTAQGDILLVEAKAHVQEMCSSGTSASPKSRKLIQTSLNRVARQLQARPDRAPWSRFFYQLANRLAYLEFLRARNVKAWLVLVNFLNDSEMGGPNTPETWEAAYQVAMHVMGLRQDHRLSPYVIHVYPDVSEHD